MGKFYPIQQISPYFSVLLALVACLIYIGYKSRLASLSLIFVYLLYSVVTDILLTPFFLHFLNNPFIGSRIFTLIEFSLIGKFLFDNHDAKYKSRIFYPLSILFFLSFFADFIINYTDQFDSVATGVSSLILLIFSIHLLYNKISSSTSIFKLDGIFILSSSFILYFSGTFFIYIFSSSYLDKESFKELYNIINSVVLIIRNSLIITSLFRYLKTYPQTSNIKNTLHFT